MEVLVIGRGLPILFLHGLGANRRTWTKVARAFVRENPGYCCWLPDLLGRGRSVSEPGLRFRMEDEVRRLETLIDKLAGRRPNVIAGHSQGAALALALARVDTGITALLLSNPVTELVRRPPILRLLATHTARAALSPFLVPLSGLVGRRVIERAAGPAFAPSATLVEDYTQPWADLRRAQTLLEILFDWEPSRSAAFLPDRVVEARVVAGRFDRRIPVEAAEQLALGLGAPFHLVEDGGHILPEQCPDLLAASLAELIPAQAPNSPAD